MIDEPDPIDIAVGARLRLLRKERNLSQSVLAESLGVSFQQVQKYERGTNRISVSVITKIARCLEVSASTLLGEADGAISPEIIKGLEIPGAAEMLAAFADLQPAVRQSLLAFTRSLSGKPHLRLVKD